MALTLLRQWASTDAYKLFVYNDEVYVVSGNDSCVYVYDLNGNLQRTIGSGPGSGNGQLTVPHAVCVSGGEVYVMDSGNNRVEVFNIAGVYQRKWGSSGTGNGQFSGGTAINVYGGEVYTADGGINHRIQVFTTAGVYQRKWGSSGTGDGQFQIPMSCFGYGGEIYVADLGGMGDRIQVFNTAGVFQRKWFEGWVGDCFVYSSLAYFPDVTWRFRVSDLVGSIIETVDQSGVWGLCVYDNAGDLEVYVSCPDDNMVYVYGSANTPEINLSVVSLSPTCYAETDAPSDSFGVSNTGDTGSTLNYGISDDVAWLVCVPVSGAVDEGDPPDSIAVNYATSGLVLGKSVV